MQRKQIVLALSFLVLASITVRWAAPQGMATGSSVAVPTRPLPPGMKAPTIRFEDIADQTGISARSTSGADTNKQYILETIGTGVAIFDYDNDGLPDVF